MYYKHCLIRAKSRADFDRLIETKSHLENRLVEKSGQERGKLISFHDLHGYRI